MTEFFAAGSGIASLAFVALVAYAHLARRELDGASTALSEYFSGRTRHLMLAAYFCLSLALVCAAMKIIRAQGGFVSGMGVASGVLMLVAAACLIAVAFTTRSAPDADTRSATTRSTHRVLTLVAFTAVVVAMLVYSLFGLPSDHRYQRSLRTWAILVSIFALMDFMLLLRVPPGSPYYGLIQKLLAGLVAAWLFISAWA